MQPPASGPQPPQPSPSNRGRLPAELPLWSIAAPLLGLLLLALAWGRPVTLALGLAVGALLAAAVLAAVHHAEVVALRVGEPFGTLTLAIAVTVIEVALIVALMLAGGPDTSVLARDTVFAAIMIVCNGVVGLCVLVGGMREHVVTFRREGTNSALTVLVALATLTLVLPSFTTTTAGPTFAASQLVFSAIVSLVLYGVFVFVQTVRHRDYFLPHGEDDGVEGHAAPPSNLVAFAAFGLLVLCLIVVVGLAKTLAPTIEAAVARAGAPQALVGVIIALLVLLPETGAALRAARRNRLQNSLSLALGSALASIALTIPAVAAISLGLGTPLSLGLPAVQITLLALTFGVAVLTLASGRATVLQGAVHLVLFAVFVFLAVVP